MIERKTIYTEPRDGWQLGLRRTIDLERHNPAYRPIAIIPGYGMNTFIFGFHPAGRPLEEFLAEAGHEVWAVPLRAMDGAINRGGETDYGMQEISVVDVGSALETIAANTTATVDKIDLIGCSLGGTIVFAHLALVPDNRVGSVIALGAPLRWVEKNPLLSLAFSSPWLARRLRVKGVRKLARVVLPLLERAPWLLSIYIHPNLVDMSAADKLVQVVEDPNPVLNEEIVRWFKNGDLVIDGVNVTEALREMKNPLLAITGNADGIVPTATARFPIDWVASARKTFLEVGDAERRYAHADLYISRYSHELVFAPLVEWLEGCYA